MPISIPVPAAPRNVAPELAQLTTALDRIAENVAGVLADKKITPMEYVQLFGNFADVQVILAVYPAAAKYFLSLSPDEQAKVVEEFAFGLDIPNEDAEIRIKETLNGSAKIYKGLSTAYAGVRQIHKAYSNRVSNDLPDAPTPVGKKK